MMAVLEDLGVLSFVERSLKNGSTHKAITEDLRTLYPGVRGISVRSLKRFCAAHQLHSTSRLTDQALDVLVSFAVQTVSDECLS